MLWRAAIIFEPRYWVSRKKSLPLVAALLKSTRDRATTCGFVLVRAHRKLGKKKPTPGALPATSRQLHFEHPVCFFAVKSKPQKGINAIIPTRANRHEEARIAPGRGGKPTPTQARRPRRDLDREGGGARTRVGACPSVCFGRLASSVHSL